MIKAIVYTSNAGHTKQYAQLLGGKISLPAYSVKEAKRALAKGDEIIYLGWLMAGKIKGYKKANRRFSIKALCLAKELMVQAAQVLMVVQVQVEQEPAVMAYTMTYLKQLKVTQLSGL